MLLNHIISSTHSCLVTSHILRVIVGSRRRATVVLVVGHTCSSTILAVLVQEPNTLFSLSLFDVDLGVLVEGLARQDEDLVVYKRASH